MISQLREQIIDNQRLSARRSRREVAFADIESNSLTPHRQWEVSLLIETDKDRKLMASEWLASAADVIWPMSTKMS